VPDTGRTIAYSMLALVAFAANSVLCRLALRDASVDPATFSTIRLVAGAVTLLLFAGAAPERTSSVGISLKSAAMLALYAVSFAFAYVSLAAGTGALILFGSVQVTMLVGALIMGERPSALQWFGLSLALSGLVYLVSPGLAAPSPSGAMLMSTAGFSWGVYSLRGKGVHDPLARTTANFLWSLPLVLGVSLASLQQFHLEPKGAALAAVSGSVTSGLGYVAWFAALRGLSAARASIVQLAVPVLAAAGGVVALAEPVSVRLVLASVMVLGGILLATAWSPGAR
jgi:drug/metabolite transporter (DMT)-like permease